MAYRPRWRRRTRQVAGVLVMAVLWAMTPRSGHGQTTIGLLRITVALAGADRVAVPVPRHALLVSDDPPSAAPRRVVTGADGTATLRLPPGTYTVESDLPVAFQGREYQWRQTLDVQAGQDAKLDLTADNAEVGSLTSASTTSSGRTSGASEVVMLWQDSVVALWTPTAPASGFVIDSRGLVATSQQAIGTATSIEVQLTPTVKVRGNVLVADRAADVAVLRIDPAALGSIKPVALGCGPPPRLANGQEVIALGLPTSRPTNVFSGAVNRVAARAMIADLRLKPGSAGGPVFAGGQMVGLTSFVGAKESGDPDDARVIRIDGVCEVVAAAETAMKSGGLPDGARLPVEPTRTLSVDALKDAAQRRAGGLNPYQIASSGFDIAFITPVSAYAGMRAAMDFSNWSDYVADAPSVLLVRVTPKQAESVWARIARGVAITQGVALPPIKRFVSGFARLRVRCGAAEVTPIHPFLLERRISETDAIYEGLYVFDPEALGPHCGTVTLEAFSDKTPPVADTVTVDATVLQQIWQDFASYRALK